MELASVESLCNALARSKLLSADEIRNLHRGWVGAAGTRAADVGEFGKWLVARHAVTEYQLGMLQRGHGERLFLGPYKLIERVGKGRMAGVYKAVHTLGQTVAIKILPPSKAKDPQILGRFQREAKLALGLQHPNIVRTFQAGVLDGLYYLVMEYLEGETFDDVLQRRRKLPPAEAVRVVHQALLGLQCLHEKGLVHRDLKPGNLMLVGRPAGARDTTLNATVKILDIGTGRALFVEDTTPEGKPFELTTDSDILGTPDYMAPEQAKDAHSADIRSDIYSLGCVLYHALAGQPPFPDTNIVRKVIRHATEAPRPVREFSPEVPDGLQQILDWMLAKDPGKRYPTPGRAAQALQVFLAAGGGAAGAQAQEPKMAAYLKWLAAQPADQATVELKPAEAPTAPPKQHTGTLAPQPSPVAQPAGRPAPGGYSLSAGQDAGAAPPAAKGARRPAPVARAAAAPRPRERDAQIPLAVEAVEEAEVDVEPVGPPQAGAGSRRKLFLILGILLGLGLLLLVCAGVVGMIAWHFLAAQAG